MEVNVLHCVLTVMCALIMSTNFNLAFCLKIQHDKSQPGNDDILYVCGIFQLFTDCLVYFSLIQPPEQRCRPCLILTDIKDRSANSQL